VVYVRCDATNNNNNAANIADKKNIKYVLNVVGDSFQHNRPIDRLAVEAVTEDIDYCNTF